jgi:hypothetical protein
MLEPHITTGRLDLSYDPEPNMEDVEPQPVHDDFEIMTAQSLYSHGSSGGATVDVARRWTGNGGVNCIGDSGFIL